MIWRDHVFNYGPKSATRVTKFREKKTGEALAETVFSRNFVTLVADFGPKLKTWFRQIMFYTRNKAKTKSQFVIVLAPLALNSMALLMGFGAWGQVLPRSQYFQVRRTFPDDNKWKATTLSWCEATFWKSNRWLFTSNITSSTTRLFTYHIN